MEHWLLDERRERERGRLNGLEGVCERCESGGWE